MIKTSISARFYSWARGQGFEPRLPGPEPGVLPLDDPRIFNSSYFLIFSQSSISPLTTLNKLLTAGIFTFFNS